MGNGEPASDSVYFYAPIHWAPPIFATLFLVATIVHVWQCIRYKVWRVTGLHPLCGLLFTIGFAIRSYGTFDYENVNVYTASTIFIYCAPAIGVSWLSNPNVPDNYAKIEDSLMKAALILQIGIIGLFCAISGVFHRRCVKGGITTRKVQGPLLTLYISTTLILMRTIYRMVEHFDISRITLPTDWDPMTLSPIVRYEWFFWVFEASLMLVNTALWNLRHPRRYLPEDYHMYLAQDGKTELKGPGWKDEMPWFMTFIDPCGLTVAVTGGGRSKEEPFWEMNGHGSRPSFERQAVLNNC